MKHTIGEMVAMIEEHFVLIRKGRELCIEVLEELGATSEAAAVRWDMDEEDTPSIDSITLCKVDETEACITAMWLSDDKTRIMVYLYGYYTGSTGTSSLDDEGAVDYMDILDYLIYKWEHKDSKPESDETKEELQAELDELYREKEQLEADDKVCSDIYDSVLREIDLIKDRIVVLDEEV